MFDIPDFLKLSPEKVEQEKERQAELRRAFNSRARLSPAEMEESRARILVAELKEMAAEQPELYADRYAETLGTLGMFTEAAKVARDPEIKVFYEKASKVTTEKCGCAAKVVTADGKKVQLPRHRTIKEFDTYILAECNTCQHWTYIP